MRKAASTRVYFQSMLGRAILCHVLCEGMELDNVYLGLK
jgi:hypothetical protein